MMFKSFMKIENMALKLMIPIGFILFANGLIWSRITINAQQKVFIERAVTDTDMIVALEHVTRIMAGLNTVSLLIVLGLIIYVWFSGMVTRPIKQLIEKTDLIGKGVYQSRIHTHTQNDEIGALSVAIHDMGEKVRNKQEELNQQKDMYQDLFDQVPCTITVQNRDFKLIEFNRTFSKKFNPGYGDYCFSAYKNKTKKCDNCPVERTFIDGQSHTSEESGINKDGTISHWFVKTAPLRNEKGQIVAAMEMTIDISRRKKLEEIVKDSERKYQAIFRSIPNPVFIVDMDTFKILACNNSAMAVYDYKKDELENQVFSILFPSLEKFNEFKEKIDQPFHERLINFKKNKESMFVNIWVSPTRFTDQDVLLITVIDTTFSVETELQLIQAGKMATLGEMATGVAHELNQPLSVIKTASSFISKKISRNEPIDTQILATLSQEIESHVDRASKTINHMRLFGRKSNFSKENVNLNHIIKQAFDIFSQQLKLREINIEWNLDKDIPAILADPVKLEQVIINLLINARDAIVTRFKTLTDKNGQTRLITITTSFDSQQVKLEISDTGTGIPQTNINKIFEPFFTTKKVGDGTGLGLSISYGIIKEAGGRISARNNIDHGATFTIIFPVSLGGKNDQ
ncbi:MAG: ATP-binding protein [Pseudomonadota bacterium]